MKIIGTGNDRTFVAVLTEDELRAYFNLTYGSDADKAFSVKVGDEIDLRAGFDFYNEIRRLKVAVEDCAKRFERCIGPMTKFLGVLNKQSENPD